MTHPVYNKLDPEIIARMKLGIKHKSIAIKQIKPNRKASTYRAARRNAMRAAR